MDTDWGLNQPTFKGLELYHSAIDKLFLMDALQSSTCICQCMYFFVLLQNEHVFFSENNPQVFTSRTVS